MKFLKTEAASGPFPHISAAYEIDGRIHRKSFQIGTDVSGEHEDIQALAKELWTRDVRDAWNAHQQKTTPEERAARVKDAVKSEAYRRIVAVCPEWKQRNLTAQATILAKKGAANWTAGEQAAWDAGEAIWAQVDAIRAASDVLEAMDTIPADFRDDRHWP